MAQQERRYSVGLQTFSSIIQSGRVYVDKTDLVWQAQQVSKYIFLSRPRRFGKSLLTTTFASFFRAEKELFEGLKVNEALIRFCFITGITKFFAGQSGIAERPQLSIFSTLNNLTNIPWTRPWRASVSPRRRCPLRTGRLNTLLKGSEKSWNAYEKVCF